MKAPVRIANWDRPDQPVFVRIRYCSALDTKAEPTASLYTRPPLKALVGHRGFLPCCKHSRAVSMA